MATQANALQTAAQNKAVSKGGGTLKALLPAYLPAFKAALPQVMSPERFVRLTQSALSTTPALMQTTPKSFFGALMATAQLGLEPNTILGQAYLIPRKNHGVMETTLQIGYKGLVALCYRSGQVASIQAETVYENDEFRYELGLDPKLKHVPARKDRGNPIYYYAVWKGKDGATGFAVMSVEDILAHAKKFSSAFGSGPWQTDFDSMAKKTVLKQALKYAPISSDFARGIAADETVRDFEEGTTDILDKESKVIDVEADPAEPAPPPPAPAEGGKTVEEVL